jgi:hypothetical protein
MIRLINPCKQCFVYPVCREECKLYAEYYATYTRLIASGWIWIGLSIIQVFTAVFMSTFKIPILNYIPVLLIVIYSVLLKIKVTIIRNDRTKRFNVPERVVYAFEPRTKF